MSGAFAKFDLTGKTALITGGATGIGFEMSRALAQAGAKVMIAARREDVLAAACAELAQDPYIDEVLYHAVDLGNRESVVELIDHVKETLGGVDIYIGNAAAIHPEQILDVDPATIDTLTQVNLASNIAIVKGLLPGMQERRWGRILFSSSVATLKAAPKEGNFMYTVTKAGLNVFARALAADFGHYNITANAIVLGFFRTSMVLDAEKHLTETQGAEGAAAFMSGFTNVTALGRMAEPSEIGGLVQLLASDAGGYITGTNMVIDGGMNIMMRPNPKEQ